MSKASAIFFTAALALQLSLNFGSATAQETQQQCKKVSLEDKAISLRELYKIVECEVSKATNITKGADAEEIVKLKNIAATVTKANVKKLPKLSELTHKLWKMAGKTGNELIKTQLWKLDNELQEAARQINNALMIYPINGSLDETHKLIKDSKLRLLRPESSLKRGKPNRLPLSKDRKDPLSSSNLYRIHLNNTEGSLPFSP